jgi:hypothetical protein
VGRAILPANQLSSWSSRLERRMQPRLAAPPIGSPPKLPARFAARGSATTTAATARTSAATAVTSATAKPIATTAATESTGTRFARACFVHRERSATQFGPVQGRHCFICIPIHRHFHKRETARLACIPVFHNLHPVHLAVCGKSRIQILLGRLERNVPDINVLQGVLLIFCRAGKLISSRELISAGI